MSGYAGIALGFVGGAVGSVFGVPWLGYAVGNLVGNALFPTELDPIRREGPKLGDLKITSSTYGRVLPILFGQGRISGQIIWSTERLESSTTTSEEVGGKGGPTQEVTTTTY